MFRLRLDWVHITMANTLVDRFFFRLSESRMVEGGPRRGEIEAARVAGIPDWIIRVALQVRHIRTKLATRGTEARP